MTTPFFSVNGFRAVDGRLTIPRVGPWVADIDFAEADVFNPGDRASIALGDLTLIGTIKRSATFVGGASARIVAGFGGWANTIPSKGYSHPNGLLLSDVLKDVAQTVKEQVNVVKDKTIGLNYCRRNDLASRVLRHLVNGQWFIDNNGITQIDDRAPGAIADTFQILDYKPLLGQFHIATETFSNWMPGRQFTAPTLTDVNGKSVIHTISSSTFAVKDGKLTLTILNGQTREERLQEQMRAIIQDERSRADYGRIVEYIISSASSMSISCDPVDQSQGWPSLQNVPLKAGIMGETVTPTSGAKCLIMFMNSDPTLYRCIACEGIAVTTSLSTSGDFDVVTGGLFNICGASDFVALAGKVLTQLQNIKTYNDAHTHPTPWGPSGPPLVPMTAPSSMACTKLKTD